MPRLHPRTTLGAGLLLAGLPVGSMANADHTTSASVVYDW